MEDFAKVYLFMVRNFLILVTVLIANIGLSLCSWAGLPSIESLLRNANNPEVTNNYVEASFVVGDLSEQHKNFLVEVIFENNKGKNRFWQIIYDSSKASEENIISVLDSNLVKKKIEQELFYAVLSNVMINSSLPMLSFLKRENRDFKKNSEMINPEKLKMIRNYVNASSQGAEEIKNNAIMRQPFITNFNDVELIQEGEDFQIQAKSQNTKLKFANESHHLLFLEQGIDSTKFNLELGQYEAFDGTYFLPKEFMVRTLTEKIYRINFVSLKHYDTTEQLMIDKIGKLKTKAVKSLQQFEDVSFLLR